MCDVYLHLPCGVAFLSLSHPAEVFGPPFALKVDLHRGNDSCVICIDGRLGKVVMAVKPSLDRDRQGMHLEEGGGGREGGREGEGGGKGANVCVVGGWVCTSVSVCVL